MRIKDERETKNKQTNKQRQKRTMGGGGGSIVKGWKLNDFVVCLS